MCSSTTAERQSLASRDRTCCLRRCLPARPLRFYGFRGSIAHPTQSLCTLRTRRRRRPRNTRYRAPATAYPDRSLTGRNTPALPGAQAIHSSVTRRDGLLRSARNDDSQLNWLFENLNPWQFIEHERVSVLDTPLSRSMTVGIYFGCLNVPWTIVCYALATSPSTSSTS